jgi:hypothetical protein
MPADALAGYAPFLMRIGFSCVSLKKNVICEKRNIGNCLGTFCELMMRL